MDHDEISKIIQNHVETEQFRNRLQEAIRAAYGDMLRSIVPFAKIMAIAFATIGALITYIFLTLNASVKDFNITIQQLNTAVVVMSEKVSRNEEDIQEIKSSNKRVISR